jgi:hypothetical protein
MIRRVKLVKIGFFTKSGAFPIWPKKENVAAASHSSSIRPCKEEMLVGDSSITREFVQQVGDDGLTQDVLRVIKPATSQTDAGASSG